MDTSQHVNTLVELGLTKLEAEIYLSLHLEGKSNATKISKTTNISRPDVYRVLSRLQKDCLIEKEINYPNEYKAVPVQEAIDMLLKLKTKKLVDLQAKTDLLLHNLNKPIKDKKLYSKSKFIMVPSRKILLNKLRNAIENTKKTIDVSTSAGRFFFACSSFSKSLDNAWSRGVKGRVVIEEVDESRLDIIKDAWKNPFAEIKFLPTIPNTIMAIYDKKQIFIFLEKDADLKDSPALWSNDSNLLSMANDFFEILWITAMPTPHQKTD